MGYPAFGKVKTITLPIPDSSMTFAKYKNAFGIDLQQLENTELILLKEPSGDIVPVLYYDKENAVLYTANYSCDISDGFEVGADSLISKVIAGGTIENAKPVYCHPITLNHPFSSNKGLQLTCLIFNNSATAFTAESFADYIKNLYESVGETIRILVSGTVQKSSDGNVCIASYMGMQSNQYFIQGYDIVSNTPISAQSGLTKTQFVDLLSDFNDGVNKIN